MKSRGVPGVKRFPLGVPLGYLSKSAQLRIFSIGRPKGRYEKGLSCSMACLVVRSIHKYELSSNIVCLLKGDVWGALGGGGDRYKKVCD